MKEQREYIRITVPKCISDADHAIFMFNLTMREEDGLGPKIMVFFGACFVDQWQGINNKSTCTPIGFMREKTPASATLQFFNEKSIYVKDAKLFLQFLTDTGYKLTYTYEYAKDNNTAPVRLASVKQVEMNDKEKEFFEDNLPREPIPPIIRGGQGGKVLGKGPDVDFPEELGPFVDALDAEKRFLQNAGGTRHRITNGRIVKSEPGAIYYVFDMESELYLPEDTPVVVILGDISVPGSVLVCEDFKILLQLKKNIGDIVGTAYMAVEPWKLLESLKDRLTHRRGSPYRIASMLYKDGPKQATGKPVDLVAKGQDEAIKFATSKPITIIWGPPGTGKTHVMAEITAGLLERGKSVLIVSHSNVSVDGAALKVYDLLKQKNQESLLQDGRVLRYGYVREPELRKNAEVNSFEYTLSKKPDLKSKLEELQRQLDALKLQHGFRHPSIVDIQQKISVIHTEVKKEEREYVNRASVVATTISKVVADSLFDEKMYDVVMFDEASMAYFLQVECAATYARKHFICIGDFMQLPPIVQCPKAGKLKEDVFEYLNICVNGKPYYHPWMVMLYEQRRMHPAISAFPKRYMYENLLEDHESVIHGRDAIVEKNPLAGSAIGYIDLFGSFCFAGKNSDNSRFNVLSSFVSYGMALKHKEAFPSIAVITPYAAQTRLIRAMMLDYRKEKKENHTVGIRCSTVHQFQGSESDFVIFDAVESYPSKKAGFLMDRDYNSVRRLVNVAVTRARGKFITIANSKFWENQYRGTQHALYQLQKYLFSKGTVVDQKNGLSKFVSDLSVSSQLHFFTAEENYEDKLIEDLCSAELPKISLPSGLLKKDLQAHISSLFEDLRSCGRDVLVKTGDYANLPDDWKKYAVGTDNAYLPLIIIDDTILWYGALEDQITLSGEKDTAYKDVCKFVIRYEGTDTISLIKSFLEYDYIETASGKRPWVPKYSDDPSSEGRNGLIAYLLKRNKCKCGNDYVIARGKTGTPYLRCPKCKNTRLINKDDVQYYIYLNDVTCPKCGSELKAGIGKRGLYIRCQNGDFTNIEDI